MPEITVSEAQREYLEDLREHIAAQHAGPYGHVRLREVIQFLIDRYEGAADHERETVRRAISEHLADRSYQALQQLAAETAGVEPGGKADDLRERLVAARVEALIDEGETPDTTEDGDWDAGPDQADAAAEAEPTAETDPTETETDPTEAASAGSSLPDPAASGSRLQRMMGLLDEHDDKWAETDSDEGKYAVTLPDGSVETVRTKDDVRAALFKHYE